MPGWDRYDVPRHIQQSFAVPVLVDNDVNIMALGEQHAHLPAVKDLVFIKVATGIGAGLISGGELQRGAQGQRATSAMCTWLAVPMSNADAATAVASRRSRPDLRWRGTCATSVSLRRAARTWWTSCVVETPLPVRWYDRPGATSARSLRRWSTS